MNGLPVSQLVDYQIYFLSAGDLMFWSSGHVALLMNLCGRGLHRACSSRDFEQDGA
jgi:hypothetical protein